MQRSVVENMNDLLTLAVAFLLHSLGFIAYFLSDIFISIRYNRNEIKKEGDK